MTVAELTTFVTTPEFFSGVTVGVAVRKGGQYVKDVLGNTKVENNG